MYVTLYSCDCLDAGQSLTRLQLPESFSHILLQGGRKDLQNLSDLDPCTQSCWPQALVRSSVLHRQIVAELPLEGGPWGSPGRGDARMYHHGQLGNVDRRISWE